MVGTRLLSICFYPTSQIHPFDRVPRNCRIRAHIIAPLTSLEPQLGKHTLSARARTQLAVLRLHTVPRV